MGRSPCCDKDGLKKGPWTAEEDAKLVQYIQIHGPGNWRILPRNAGLQRCGKSCRLRWTNYLRPDIKRGRFSFDEEETIIQLHSILGNKWSAIAARLPGRTDNEIKNYWNTHIRKRLLRMGIDPITHGPRLDIFDLSSILASSSSSSSSPSPTALLRPHIDSLSTLVHLQQTLLLNPHALRLALAVLTSSKSQPRGEEAAEEEEEEAEEIMWLRKLKHDAAGSQHFLLQHQSQPPPQQFLQQPNPFENLVNLQPDHHPHHHHHQDISGSVHPIDLPNDGDGIRWKVSSESGFSGESLLRFEIPEGIDLDEFIM